jgi:hypothetical protein
MGIGRRGPRGSGPVLRRCFKRSSEYDYCNSTIWKAVVMAIFSLRYCKRNACAIWEFPEPYLPAFLTLSVYCRQSFHSFLPSSSPQPSTCSLLFQLDLPFFPLAPLSYPSPITLCSNTRSIFIVSLLLNSLCSLLTGHICGSTGQIK